MGDWGSWDGGGSGNCRIGRAGVRMGCSWAGLGLGFATVEGGEVGVRGGRGRGIEGGETGGGGGDGGGDGRGEGLGGGDEGRGWRGGAFLRWSGEGG
jgi:hypothetical protein